ncbi:hypothetical protein OK015_24240 [Mycobacterium sp. Aquia_216]|uniref:hypothetical protein n=1 Tax=Mycobacterium sp. Aquia_216 TaxID=2991729 RepID=UPI00227A28FC|nr:hypothetical protein [Mycobacterium sp. Aquia_216]WAJ44217.1 hypothetical protein OK015_24240 [Mycobacterium sp. Aquia_216]
MSLVTTQPGGLAAPGCRPSETDSAMNRGRPTAATAAGGTTPSQAAAHAVAAN